MLKNIIFYQKKIKKYYVSLFRYESLVGSMRKKFAKKRDRSAIIDREEDVNSNVVDCKPKKAFLKPQD